ncbi:MULTISPECIES: hypothetical protein [Actinoalloteichus]|uniref:Ribonuclease HI n=1 Tax=Actinoalloteichus fjordicus TaxID=1612552 RepID=A0AAC9LCK0_9PSEU|nr:MULTISPECIES: hypothetical protein [Actinoalloteichus]APU13930.1 ribonuclease HI [Actinoalloteichus fjordicus]APU19876.1 ribonuclease HI [Actinoalloteichus sp. GBA129-24]
MTDQEPDLGGDGVHRCPAAAPRPAAHVWILPAVAGGLFWGVSCSRCPTRWHGIVHGGVDDALREATAGITPETFVKRHHLISGGNRLHQWISRSPDVPPLLRRLVAHDPTFAVDGEYRLTADGPAVGSADVVAADASFRPANGAAGWAVVTGRGWHDSGRLDPRHPWDSHSAEVMAAAHAASLYPRGHSVTVVTDSRMAAEVLDILVNAGSRRRRRIYPGLTVSERGLNMIEDLTKARCEGARIRFVWKPRNTDAMLIAADTLAAAAAVATTEVTHPDVLRELQRSVAAIRNAVRRAVSTLDSAGLQPHQNTAAMASLASAYTDAMAKASERLATEAPWEPESRSSPPRRP